MKPANNYTVYLSTECANSPVHGLFALWNDTKQPIGAHGCKSFDKSGSDAVSLQSTTKNTLIGRAFGANDGFIGIDCDKWIPAPDWTNGTGYTEISVSGTGAHIITRIPPNLIPRDGNKIVLNDSNHKIELFYGRNVGIALTGTQARAGTSIDLDLHSQSGKIIIDAFRQSPTASDIPSTPDISDAPNIPITKSPSEAFLSITTRIARDLALEEVNTGNKVLTPANIQNLWEQTDVYREHYLGNKRKYHATKVRNTIDKAYEAGIQLRNEYINLSNEIQGTKPTLTPQKAKQQKFPEGFIMNNGVPEFWCEQYNHPLRYHLAYIAKYAYEVASRPRAIVAWTVASIFAVALCGRQYTAFGGRVYSRLYIILSAPSGAGKGDIRRALRWIAMDCASTIPKISNLIAYARNWTSDAAVHATIAETPQSVAVWDECGHKISQMLSDPIAMSVFTELTEAFSEADGILDAKKYADKKDKESKAIPILRPAMSVIGLGTPEQMAAITEEMIADGRFSRWLYVLMPSSPVRLNESDITSKHLNKDTKKVISEILRTATMKPDIHDKRETDPKTHETIIIPTRQEVIKNLEFDRNSLKSWSDIDFEYQERISRTKDAADRAILARALEIASSMAISRTLLGTSNGLESTEIPCEVLRECLDEVEVSFGSMHALWALAPAYTPREKRIAGIMAEIFAKTVAEPYYRVYWSPAMADALKQQGIAIKGANGERKHIDEILLSDYHIGVGKEGNTMTGRKYYYDITGERAQTFQNIVDASLLRMRARDEKNQPE